MSLFVLGNMAAVDLFNYQFIAAGFNGDIRLETTLSRRAPAGVGNFAGAGVSGRG